MKEIVYTKEPKKGEGIVTENDAQYFVSLDTRLTDSLKEEGFVNDFTRAIQNARKNKRLKMSDKIDLTYATTDQSAQQTIEKYTKEIQKAVNAKSMKQENDVTGEQVKIERVVITIGF